ncbi:hypothetical protein [Amycolatopsis sp. cmx-4-68]|uniref:hypothetical protein n=1 Tax=Amycolatopsis sp. cmx-4-68 TaxID=2790938 RepID=UPI00397E6481
MRITDGGCARNSAATPALHELHQQLLRGGAPAVRHGVTHEPNPLVGRDTGLAAVARLLRKSQVTSIAGSAGLAKTWTRLAHAVSRRADRATAEARAVAYV